MLVLLVLPIFLCFGPAAVWACRSGGQRRLWLVCVLVLLLVVVAAVGVSIWYAVPSTWHVVIYFLSFWGMSVVLSASSVALSRSFALPVQLLAAGTGTLVGLAVGYLLAVLVLRRL
jgi:hypothetical protein